MSPPLQTITPPGPSQCPGTGTSNEEDCSTGKVSFLTTVVNPVRSKPTMLVLFRTGNKDAPKPQTLVYLSRHPTSVKPVRHVLTYALLTV